jgi:multisubunit Na+/H+ antiporter MnhE subunit
MNAKHARRLRVAVELVAWWAILVVIYLASLTTASAPEYVAAVSSGLVSAVLAVAARRVAAARWGFPGRVLRMGAAMPIALLADWLRVFALLAHPRTLRHASGRLTEVMLPKEPAPTREGRLSAGSWMISATPGTLVIDDEPDEPALTIHRLVDGDPDLAQEVMRK